MNSIVRKLQALATALILTLVVIVSISPLHARAEADKCVNPGPGLDNFIAEIPPRPSPVYPFYNADDGELTIADFKGQGVVLNYWATWCAPCVKELPALVNLKKAVAKDGITVLALSQDRGGAAKVVPFFKRLKITELDVLIDKKGKVARKSGVRGLPLTILVDPDGLERGRVMGIAEWDTAESIDFIRRCIGPDAS